MCVFACVSKCGCVGVPKCVCVCVFACVSKCVCVCVRERERERAWASIAVKGLKLNRTLQWDI